MKSHRLLALFAAVALTASASAQSLEPGLWEVTSQMKSASGDLEAAAAQMQKEMAAMDPAQRKMMEDMMSAQGVKMGAAGTGAVSVKTCLTKEMIERNEVPAQQGKCKTVAQPRDGNVTKLSFTCTDPVSSGEGQYTVVSPKAYTMKMVVRAAANGGTETMNLDAAGKWLGADCGGLAPKAAPAGK